MEHRHHRPGRTRGSPGTRGRGVGCDWRAPGNGSRGRGCRSRTRGRPGCIGKIRSDPLHRRVRPCGRLGWPVAECGRSGTFRINAPCCRIRRALLRWPTSCVLVRYRNNPKQLTSPPMPRDLTGRPPSAKRRVDRKMPKRAGSFSLAAREYHHSRQSREAYVSQFPEVFSLRTPDA